MDRQRKGTQSKWSLAARIVAERRAVQARLAALDRQDRSRDLASGGDNTPVSEVLEAAQDAMERDLMLASRDVLVRRLKALARADAKIREGTYGRCEVCRAPISVARLRALPEAVRCAHCANQLVGAA